MTTTRADAGPYSRVYWRFIEEYPDIYDDDRAFATWTRLLILAEGTHPQPAPLPRKVSGAVLNKLIDVGLVTLLAGDRYRVKGLEAERARRAVESKNGGTVRAENAERGPDGRFLPSSGGASAGTSGGEPATVQSSSDSKAEQSKDKTSKDEQEHFRARSSGLEPIGAILPDVMAPDPDVGRLQRLAEELTQQAYVMASVHSGFGKKAVDEQLRRHGYDRTENAWRQIANRAKAEGKSLPTLKQLVLGADDILNPVPRADSKELKAEEEREAYNRRVARTQAEIRLLHGES